jgi:hypothetical protein
MICSRRLFGLFAMLCLLGSAFQVGIAGLARANEELGRSAPAVVQPYQQGPLDARDPFTIPEMPDGAEELLGLSVLAAILYGLRASGLAREPERPGRLRGR